MPNLEVKIESSSPSEYERVVNEEIDGFEEFFSKKLGNDPLVKGERAIIKTFLAWKLGLAKAG